MSALGKGAFEVQIFDFVQIADHGSVDLGKGSGSCNGRRVRRCQVDEFAGEEDGHGSFYVGMGYSSNMGQLFRGSQVDLTITVDREKLIGILTDNRQRHEAHHRAAFEGYKKKLIEHAEDNLALAKEGKHPRSFSQPAPRHYLPQYNRALGMLKLTDDEKIRLSAYDYARFVEDDWDWKDEFAKSSVYYNASLGGEFEI